MAMIERRTNESGAITFRVRVRLKGHPVETATFYKISEAKLWASQTESAIRERRYFKAAETKRQTLSNLIERYQKEVLPFKSTSDRFVRGQHAQLEWWKQQLGDFFLCDVTASKIVAARSKLAVSTATANRYTAALSHAFTIAVREWEWMDDNPVRKIFRLREPRGRVRFLSDIERDTLLGAVQESGNQSLHVLIILALATGARKGELLSLRWVDVDFKRSKLTFHHTKNGERRSAFIGQHAMHLLLAHHDRVKDASEFVFANSRGVPMRVDQTFRTLLEQANLKDFRFHDLRHSAASYLAMSGASVTDIAEILGHKTLSMVKRYTHLCDSHTTKVVARMNDTIFQTRTV